MRRKVCGDFEAEMREFNGEAGHVHLRAQAPLSVHGAREPGADERAFLVPVLLAASCGGAPLSIIRQYIQHQQRPA